MVGVVKIHREVSSDTILLTELEDRELTTDPLWSGVRHLHRRALVTEMSMGQEPHVVTRATNVLTNVERVKANRTGRKVTAVYPIFDLLVPINRVIFRLALP